jgi:tetratricopeptide (TPR) repeat protein
LNTALIAGLLELVLAAEEPRRLAIAKLDNGLSVGFALVRTTDQQASARLDEVALARSDGVSRVLIDRESGAYFGYRVVAGAPGNGRVRIAFQSLPDDVDAELKRKLACNGCPALTRLAPAQQRFPPPQLAGDGEAVRLELLANPTSGERIIDVIKVSARPLPSEALSAAAESTLQAWRAAERARALVARGALADAVAEYERALLLTPNDAGLETRLGACHQRLRQDAEARRHYERALELNPRHAEAWNNLGTLEHAGRRFKQAVQAYRKAVELKPELPAFWKNLGAAQLALGRVEDGLASYRKAFELDPASLESRSGIVASGLDPGMQHFFVAKMLAAAGQPETALDFLFKAQASGFRDWARVERDPDFRALQRDARFQRLLRDARN